MIRLEEFAGSRRLSSDRRTGMILRGVMRALIIETEGTQKLRNEALRITARRQRSRSAEQLALR
jgi:hypothetical protein